MKYKYSVIIPHKNTPILLQRCLVSIPTRNDLEIIIVDDNSDPNLVNFNAFPGQNRKNVKIIRTTKGKGAGFARNIGLSYASGKWILFADADDYYTVNAFSIFDHLLTKNLELLYYNIESEGESLRASHIQSLYQSYVEDNRNENLVRFGCWTPWNKVFSSSFIKKYSLQFEEIPVGNDAMFSLNSSLNARKYQITQKKLYILTENKDSITYLHRNFERKFEYLKINIRINKFMITHNLKKCSLKFFRFKELSKILIEDGPYNFMKYVYYTHKNIGIINSLLISYSFRN